MAMVSIAVWHPSFQGSVPQVVLVRAKEQVRRVLTGPHIASVTNQERSGVHTVSQEVSDSMRFYHVPGHASIELPVSVPQAGVPQPAFVRPAFVDVLPISGDGARRIFGQWTSLEFSHAIFTPGRKVRAVPVLEAPWRPALF